MIFTDSYQSLITVQYLALAWWDITGNNVISSREISQKIPFIRRVKIGRCWGKVRWLRLSRRWGPKCTDVSGECRMPMPPNWIDKRASISDSKVSIIAFLSTYSRIISTNVRIIEEALNRLSKFTVFSANTRRFRCSLYDDSTRRQHPPLSHLPIRECESCASGALATL